MADLPLLDWRPRLPRPPAAPRAVRLPTAKVDPRVALALDSVLRRHVGVANAATWEELRAEVTALGVEVAHVRRLQEAASHLRRVSKVPVGSTSQAGIYLAEDDTDRRLAAAERWKRVRSELDELAAFDSANVERVQAALPVDAPEDGGPA